MNSKAIRKQLLAAVAMVLVAAVALGSSTYAWFAAQNEVTATGMQLQAQGETGIVIKSKDNSASQWATTADASMSQSKTLKPTSTCDLAKWWHATSTEMDDEQSKQDSSKYQEVTDAKDSYVLMKSFYIRAAAQEVPVSNVKLAIKSVTAATVGNTATSENLDKSIRVGIKLANGGTGTGGVSENFFVYAPLADSDFTLTAKYSSDATLAEKKTATPSSENFTLAGNKVPANDSGLLADIYVWFEGEDANCKSSNLTATLDNLKVTVVFTTVSAGGSDPTGPIQIDLIGATASSASGDTKTINSKPYYTITGYTLNGKQLYADNSGAITSGTKIYTLTIAGDGTASDPVEVTSSCTLPTSA